MEVRFASTADRSVSDLAHLLVSEHGSAGAEKMLTSLFSSIEKRLTADRGRRDLCQQASLIGAVGYQEIRLKDVRVIYRLNVERNLAVVLLVLRENESTRASLIRHCLLKA